MSPSIHIDRAAFSAFIILAVLAGHASARPKERPEPKQAVSQRPALSDNGGSTGAGGGQRPGISPPLCALFPYRCR